MQFPDSNKCHIHISPDKMHRESVDITLAILTDNNSTRTQLYSTKDSAKLGELRHFLLEWQPNCSQSYSTPKPGLFTMIEDQLPPMADMAFS